MKYIYGNKNFSLKHFVYDLDYLCHHGIKGQSWGVQNGPPYPLNPVRDYSKAEKKAQKKEYELAKKSQKFGTPFTSSYDRMKKYSEKSKVIKERTKELDEYENKVKDLHWKLEDYSIDGNEDEKIYDLALKKATELAKKEDLWNESEKLNSKLIDYYLYDHGILDKTTKDFYKNDDNYKQLRKEYKQSIIDYKNKCGEITDEIIGEYGNQKVVEFNDDKDLKYKELVYYALSKPHLMYTFTSDEYLGRK